MKFKDAWVNKTHDIPIQAELDEAKDDVHELDEKLDQYEDAKGNPKKKSAVDLSLNKPGPSIHTSKWDKCVADVTASGTGANAYAVCTAQLGAEAFKSEYRGLAYTKSEINKARKEVRKLGIEAAGPVPNSLLAAEDLENDSKITDETNKGAVEQTGKQLETIKTEASGTESDDEKYDLAGKIKRVQQKRQKAIMEARGEESRKTWKHKTFNQFWRESKDEIDL